MASSSMPLPPAQPPPPPRPPTTLANTAGAERLVDVLAQPGVRAHVTSGSARSFRRLFASSTSSPRPSAAAAVDEASGCWRSSASPLSTLLFRLARPLRVDSLREVRLTFQGGYSAALVSLAYVGASRRRRSVHGRGQGHGDGGGHADDCGNEEGLIDEGEEEEMADDDEDEEDDDDDEDEEDEAQLRLVADHEGFEEDRGPLAQARIRRIDAHWSRSRSLATWHADDTSATQRLPLPSEKQPTGRPQRVGDVASGLADALLIRLEQGADDWGRITLYGVQVLAAVPTTTTTTTRDAPQNEG